LPMHFGTRPDAAASNHPTLWLLGQLLKVVGIPFGVVSTTAPLLQNWLTKTKTTSGKDPYFLYAVSNAGSLLALLAYPALSEPRSGVCLHRESWCGVYAVLVLMVLGVALVVWKNVHKNNTFSRHGQAISAFGKRERLSWKLRLYCMAAALVPSALMLAVTNHM